MNEMTTQQGSSYAGTAHAFLEQIDKSYSVRDDLLSNTAYQSALSRRLAEEPASYELLWRAARAKYWDADGIQLDLSAKRKLAKAGLDFGARAIAADPSRVEGHCFYAVSAGMYAEAVGIMRAVAEGLDRKFSEHMDAARDIDESFADAMPRVAKGRYFSELPWPLRDLGKARSELAQALALCPHALRAELYLAEVLLKAKAPREAEVVLRRLQTASVSYDPPEGLRVKSKAKALQRLLG